MNSSDLDAERMVALQVETQELKKRIRELNAQVEALQEWKDGARAGLMLFYPPRQGPHTFEGWIAHEERYRQSPADGAYSLAADEVAQAHSALQSVHVLRIDEERRISRETYDALATTPKLGVVYTFDTVQSGQQSEVSDGQCGFMSRYGPRCCEPEGHDGDHRFKCNGASCPGYAWPASYLAHPNGCKDEK